MLTGCVDSLDDYNVDQKRAEAVTPETLYTAALKSLMDIITTPNVNSNNYRLYVQYWTTTTYLDEPRYILTSRLIPQNFWDAMYRDVIADLVEAKKILDANALLAETTKNKQRAQLEIIEIYAWAALVNTFGDIPYTEAMNPLTPLPKYDDAETIYADLLERLDAAIPLLDGTATGFTTGEFLSRRTPAIDVNAFWRKLANSIKLKLAMIVADVPSLNPGTAVAEAYAAGVMSSNEDRARFGYIADPPNNNPVSQNLNSLFTSRQDFLVASTIVEAMKALDDPRMPAYFTQVGGAYKGGQYGMPNTYADFSKVNPALVEPTFEGLLIDNAEVQFLLAEAVERGFIAGDAETFYNQGIRASIYYWGGTEAQANAYLGQEAVAYTTAPGTWKQKIGTQKWIALFNRGWDAWIEWRRLDYPQLTPPSGEGVPVGLQIPVRIIYPINEQTLNPSNRSDAASKIGGDAATTRLFWDVQ